MDTVRGYSASYEEALQVATVAHLDQRRKGSQLPYIVHPIHVSVILLRHGFSTEIAIAGLLHDVVEDQGYELAEIERRFGPDVSSMVDALSEQKRDAQGNERAWEVRKREALEKMRGASRAAMAVKAADVLHNAQSFIGDLRREGPDVWQHFDRGPRQQLRYYRDTLDIVKERWAGHPLVSELAEAVRILRLTVRETEWDE